MNILVRTLLCLSIIFSFFGCRKFKQEKIIAEANPYTPLNLYPVERLPKYFNRVAVLPCHHNDSSSSVLNFSDEIFLQELSQARLFEPVPISPDQCMKLFGKRRIGSTESIPDNFFNLLTERYGVNGVLFIDLHSFTPYRPISLGVRAKLVDIKSGEFMWAIDETIDGGDVSVVVAANQFQRTKHLQAVSQKTSGSILQSPRLFTKFVAAQMFSTLPSR